ncbi:hypothetical protein Fmac_011359 [Flemingia macrophylla]|uniref:Uncharacterized protein n=1 Tax=Flemingia macrophylla TaxID=520843 RepID=A0ABD1MM81_9FABA
MGRTVIQSREVSLKPNLFEGMHFGFTKMLNRKFSLNHKIKQTELKANNPESLSMTQMLNASERRPNTGESSRTEMQKNADNLKQSGEICPRVQPPRV